MTLLEVSGYTKYFHIHHLEREIPVFESLDFTLRPGQFLIVSGPNGVGKSTLLRCLYRTYVPSSGQALYHSRHGSIDLARAADVDLLLLRRQEIGMVSQFLRPRPRVNALELVAEPLLSTGTDYREALDAAAALLTDFGLKQALWHAYPTTFSGGEQQKVNLARALISPRRLLLLDEPTASLDAAARDSLAARLAALKTQGVAMIGVFHHPEDVAHLVDDEILLRTVEPSINGSRGDM
jgi:alpha-D-ribose 1-methylphosphonate 5-triphosphate synthase subunit PhnL